MPPQVMKPRFAVLKFTRLGEMSAISPPATLSQRRGVSIHGGGRNELAVAGIVGIALRPQRRHRAVETLAAHGVADDEVMPAPVVIGAVDAVAVGATTCCEQMRTLRQRMRIGRNDQRQIVHGVDAAGSMAAFPGQGMPPCATDRSGGCGETERQAGAATQRDALRKTIMATLVARPCNTA